MTDHESTEDTTEVENEETEDQGPPHPGKIATILLGLESYTLPGAEGKAKEIVSDDDKSEHRALTRALALELHHALKAHFAQFDGEEPQKDYLVCLNNFSANYRDALDMGPEFRWEYETDESRVARDLYLHLCKHEMVLKKAEEGEWPPPMSKDELTAFVQDYLQNLIFTDHNIPPGEMRLMSNVFMPILFGCFRDRARFELENVGTVYENMSTAGPRGINGLPMFMSLKVMNRADWKRCVEAIKKHHQVMSTIEV